MTLRNPSISLLILGVFFMGTMPVAEAGGTPYLHQKVHSCHQEMWLGPADANYDLRFLKMAIVQRQCAIEASTEVLHDVRHPELKEMAQRTIDDQKQEMEQLKAWRKQWYPNEGFWSRMRD